MTENSPFVLCCFANKTTAGGANMIKTLQLHNWPFEIIGIGKKWEGWSTRMKAYVAFARRQTNQNRIIAFCDCYDVLAIRGPEGFLNAFHSFNADIVIGSDCINSPWNSVAVDAYWNAQTMLPLDQNYKYINGGFVCGKAFALAEMYEWIISQGIPDDQKAIGYFLNRVSFARIKLDSDKTLVFNDSTDVMRQKPLFGTENGQLRITFNGRVINPYFIHSPGFLIRPTLGFFMKNPKQSQIRNYNFVGEHLLGNDFIQIGQVDNRAHTGRVVLFWVMVGIIVFLALLLALSHARFRQKRKQGLLY